ncbi:MAG TPA: hypothetical protein DIU20_12410 [Cryomorphaceae bacterium]|nr:hypothetical protein [Owenweeksia sp.]HCQ17063.1 hypothetical protein [Cryomorphaceae bacterium]|tara:strand:+ start:6419 stop:8608 length:2190 start_codon:yes stop_codon:yes gene_type:complete
MKTPAEDQEQVVLSLLDEAYTTRINNLPKSLELAKKALLMSQGVGNNSLIGKSLNRLSLFYMIMGQYPEATRHAEEAIALFEELGDDLGVADAKYSIAGIYYKTDNYHMGLVHLIDALVSFKKHQDYHNQARVQKSLGTIYEYFGDQKNALKSYENSIDAARKASDLNLESNAYNPLSGIYLKQDKPEQAMEMIRKSVSIKEKTGDVRGLAFAIYGRAKVLMFMKQYEEAEKDLLRSMDIHDEMGERLGVGMAYNKLGVLYLSMGRLNEAEAVLKKGLDFSREFNIVMIQFKCHYLLYRVSKEKGDVQESLRHLEKYLEEKEAVINTQTLKVIENYDLISQVREMEREAKLQKEKEEIIRKKDRAEQAARVRQEFLSNMSHEIRTPLNAVASIASLLRNPGEDHAKLLNALQSATNRLTGIVDDILDYHQMDTGKMKLDLVPAEPGSVLQELEAIYASHAEEKGLKLEILIGKDTTGPYLLDRDKLGYILRHLLENALKFTPKGSIRMSVHKLEELTNADCLRFEVSDTGIGIAEDDQVRVFESFSQPKSVTTKEYEGSGLGLALVRKLVELYGSQVQLKSRPGEGATFFFDLTLMKPVKTVSSSQGYLENKRVLVAEDNPVNALVARKILEKWGMNIEWAKNGEQALEIARTQSFHYILMDIHMPVMNGFDAARKIKDDETLNKDTPIIALTADITACDNEQYHSYFKTFLLKPVIPDKLYHTLLGAG